MEFSEKLASSGVSTEQADALGMHYVNATEAGELSGLSIDGIRIPYYDASGRPLLDMGEPFYRLRYLRDPAKSSGKGKYWQPKDTMPHVYMPKCLDWNDIVSTNDQAIIITEGELKAACACLRGFNVLGLGGVYSWRAMKFGVSFLPELEQIEWKRRNVYIVFDSDFRRNKQVCAALWELAEELERRGAISHIVTLPDLPDGRKSGLDDYLVAHPGDGDFLNALKIADPLGLASVLWAQNQRYVYIREPGFVLQQERNVELAASVFGDHHTTSVYYAPTLQRDGTIKRRATGAGKEWMRWPLRTSASRVSYKPGHTGACEDGTWSVWGGWGVDPVEGDISPWNDLLDFIFSNAEPEARRWFEQWCAYPLQHPGTKMFSACIIHGITQGTGKTLIGYTLADIYGRNAAEISGKDLHSDFNDWLFRKQFIVGDDVTTSHRREDNDLLKKLITQRSHFINIKYGPKYELEDCANYYLSSNPPDAYFLEDTDRRFFVHEVVGDPLDDAFYKRYDRWLKKQKGSSYLFYHLLRIDLDGFNPFARAYRTQARSRMIAHSHSELATWVRELIDDPSILGGRDLVSAKEALVLYDPMRSTRVTATVMGRELSRAGVQQVNGGKVIRTKMENARYFVIKNKGDWFDGTPYDAANHVNSTIIGEAGSDKF